MDKSIKCFTLMRKNSKLEYVREIDGHYRNGQPIYATACISESNCFDDNIISLHCGYGHMIDYLLTRINNELVAVRV